MPQHTYLTSYVYIITFCTSLYYILKDKISNFSDQFKKIIKRYIKVGYNLDDCHATVCMPGDKPNHGLKIWFPLSLHDGGSGLRLYDGSDVKL